MSWNIIEGDLSGAMKETSELSLNHARLKQLLKQLIQVLKHLKEQLIKLCSDKFYPSLAQLGPSNKWLILTIWEVNGLSISPPF